MLAGLAHVSVIGRVAMATTDGIDEACPWSGLEKHRDTSPLMSLLRRTREFAIQGSVISHGAWQRICSVSKSGQGKEACSQCPAAPGQQTSRADARSPQVRLGRTGCYRGPRSRFPSRQPQGLPAGNCRMQAGAEEMEVQSSGRCVPVWGRSEHVSPAFNRTYLS